MFSTILLALSLSQRALAKKPNLKKLEVSALSLVASDGSSSLCAGKPEELRIQATLADGTVLDTAASGGEGLRFKDFDVTTDRGELDKQGVLLVENTGPELVGQSVKFGISSKKTPVTAEASLALHFGCEVRLDYRAEARPGAPLPPEQPPTVGKALAGGLKAMGAQMVGLGPAPGEKGEDGADGGPGQDGQPGGTGGPGYPGSPGRSLEVEVSPFEGELVLVSIAEVGVEGGLRMVVLDPAKGGRLLLDTSGGRGGEGGPGGNGGDGGPGIAEYNNGNGGNGARGGDGGQGGPGGPGGDVTVRFDASRPALADLIVVRSEGGPGGMGGAGGSFGSGGPGIEGASDGSLGSTAAERGPSGPDGAPGRVSFVPVPASSLRASGSVAERR